MRQESEGQLLNAIRADPEADEPRLVYADWLQERGEPRGELIQLQIAQARLRPGSVEFTRLQPRVDALLEAGWESWAPQVTAIEPGTFCQWRFQRGFPSAVDTVPNAFAGSMDEFFAAAPLLDDVKLQCQSMAPSVLSWLEPMIARPAFARVRALRLEAITEVGVVLLSGLPGMAKVRTLELLRSALGAGTWQLLGMEGSALRGLKRLELVMTHATDTAIEQLFRHPWTQLERLVIRNADVGERAARAIAQCGKLTQLDLSWSLTGGVAAVAALSTLPKLTELDLSYCPLTDAMIAALPPGLRALRLAHTGLTERGALALRTGLELLDVTGCALAEESLRERFGDRVLL